MHLTTILFLLGRYPGYGGIENITTLLANYLCKKYNVIICSHRQEAEQDLIPKLSSEIKFYRMPDNGIKRSERNIFFFNELILREHVNIIFNQDSYFPNEYLFEKITDDSVKIIEIEHSSPNGFEIAFRTWLKTGEGRWNLFKVAREIKHYWSSKRNEVRRSRFLYDVCDRYVMLSESLIPIRKRIGKIPDSSKFMAIGNPLAIDASKVNLLKKEKRCIFVGRLDWMKGLDRLMRIWTRVERNVPEWRLSIVGDGPEMPMVKRVIVKYNLKRVDIEGFQANVSQYYNKARILCMCSTFEGFPLVLPEAMSYGVVPIVFDSFPALHDIVRPDIDAIVVPAFDENLYITSLCTLMQDDEKYLQLCAQGLKNSDKFSVNKILYQWDGLINEVL